MMVTDEKDKFPDNEQNENSDSETNHPVNPNSPKRVRMRVKIKKKIRIKKKQSSQKSFKKAAERIFWILIIIGFFASLIIMVVELEVKDERFQQQRKKSSPARLSLNNSGIIKTENMC